MSEYTGPERRGNGGWHLSKSLSVSHIISTVAIVVAGFSWAGSLEQDILRNQLNHESLKQQVERQAESTDKALTEIKELLWGISSRLDSLADSRD